MSPWLVLVILSLATFRLTRLVTADDFPPILWARWKLQHAKPLIRKIDGDEDYWWLGELVSCLWCASAYISGGLVLITWLLGVSIPLPIFFWFATWGAGAFIVKISS